MSVFDAATLGLQAFRDSGWIEGIGPATRLTIDVQTPSVRHVVTVQQLERWAGSSSPSPTEKLQKRRLRDQR